MIGAAWDCVKEQSLKKAWNKVLCIVENPQSGCVNEKQKDMSEMIDMLKKLTCHECDKKRFNTGWISTMKIPGIKLCRIAKFETS